MKNYSRIMLLCAAVCANTVYGAQSFKETQMQRDQFLRSIMYPANVYSDLNSNGNTYMTSIDNRLKIIEAPHNNGFIRIYGNGYIEFSNKSLQTITENGKSVINDTTPFQNLSDTLVACGMGIIYPNQMKLILYDVKNAEYGISCLGLFGEKLNNTWNSNDSFKITINSTLPILTAATTQIIPQQNQPMPNIKAIAEDLTQIIKNTKDLSDINSAITNYLQSNNFLNMITNSNLATPSIQPTMPQPPTSTTAIPLQQASLVMPPMQPANQPTTATVQTPTQMASIAKTQPVMPQQVDTTMIALQQKSSAIPPMQPATTTVQNQAQMASIPSMQPMMPQPIDTTMMALQQSPSAAATMQPANPPTPATMQNSTNQKMSTPAMQQMAPQSPIADQINNTFPGNIGQPVIIEGEQVADKQKFNNEKKRNNWSSGWFKKQNK